MGDVVFCILTSSPLDVCSVPFPSGCRVWGLHGHQLCLSSGVCGKPVADSMWNDWLLGHWHHDVGRNRKLHLELIATRTA